MIKKFYSENFEYIFAYLLIILLPLTIATSSMIMNLDVVLISLIFLFTVLKENYWHQAKGTEYKRKSMQVLFNKSEVDPWIPWNVQLRVKTGTWFLDCFCESSGWFTKDMIQIGKKRELYLKTTPAFDEHKAEIVRITELFSPISWPMLIEPRDWSQLHDGGYYLNDITKCHEMVRRGVPLSIQGEKIRFSGKKRDQLQDIIAMMKEADFEIPLQFNNFRD